MTPDLHLKRIYEPPAPTDGTRVLVDRVWPRGVSKDAAALDLWLKEIAPTPALRKWFGHDPARWKDFQSRYLAELKANREAVDRLVALLRKGRVTILYGAHDTGHNHALVIADHVRKLLHGA